MAEGERGAPNNFFGVWWKIFGNLICGVDITNGGIKK